MKRPPGIRHPGMAAAGVLVLAACKSGPVDPVGLPLPPSPFERTPYVQRVDTSGAVVLWRQNPGLPATFRYRPEGSAWVEAPVRRLESGESTVSLGSLPPDSRVVYEVGAGEGRIGPAVFRTAPRPGRDPARGEEAVRVLAFGDSGWGSEAQIALARWMSRERWELAVHVGDLAYDDGAREEFTQRHFRVYARLLATTPLFPVPGNHDLRADGGRSYDEAFRWPAPWPGVRYYAFRWGGIRFIGLDTSSETEDVDGLRKGRGREYEWLVEELRGAAADETTDWVIVYMHHPLYSHAIGISGHGSDGALRTRLGPLFDRYGVDLVLAGHDHHYERSRPIRGGRPVPDGCGPVYILTGGGGASEFARDVRPSALAARTSREHHYVGMRVGSAAIEGAAIGVRGDTIDAFWIVPNRGSGEDGEACGR